jgi:hypothetical protein
VGSAASSAAGRPRRTAPSPYAVVPVVALVGGFVLFAVASDWYRAVLALHVVAAVAWVGGGVALTVLALAASRARDSEALARLVKHEEYLGQRLYMPASLVLIFGIAGWVCSTIVGMVFFAPQTKALNALIAERGMQDEEVERRIARILQVARLDLTVLLLVVLDMVTKPFS